MRPFPALIVQQLQISSAAGLTPAEAPHSPPSAPARASGARLAPPPVATGLRDLHRALLGIQEPGQPCAVSYVGSLLAGQAIDATGALIRGSCQFDHQIPVTGRKSSAWASATVGLIGPYSAA